MVTIIWHIAKIIHKVVVCHQEFRKDCVDTYKRTNGTRDSIDDFITMHIRYRTSI